MNYAFGYPKDLTEVVTRAAIRWHVDEYNRIYAIESTNKEAPLTEEEKSRLKEHFQSLWGDYKIIFLN